MLLVKQSTGMRSCDKQQSERCVKAGSWLPVWPAALVPSALCLLVGCFQLEALESTAHSARCSSRALVFVLLDLGMRTAANGFALFVGGVILSEAK